MDNFSVGHNIAKFRKIRDIKATDMATQLGMKEAAYTKYERGETAITIDIIGKVAGILKMDPLQIISVSPQNFLENIQNSPIAIQHHSTFQTYNEHQTNVMVKLMEDIVRFNERLVVLLERKN